MANRTARRIGYVININLQNLYEFIHFFCYKNRSRHVLHCCTNIMYRELFSLRIFEIYKIILHVFKTHYALIVRSEDFNILLEQNRSAALEFNQLEIQSVSLGADYLFLNRPSKAQKFTNFFEFELVVSRILRVTAQRY